MNDFQAFMLVTFVLGCPLLLAGFLVFNPCQSVAFRLASWAALPALLLCLAPNFSVQLPWLLLGSQWGMVDASGRLFLLFTALLWWLAGRYAKAYLAGQGNASRFFVYFLLAMTGNFGLILALDVASFFLFFALMSFSSYGLIVHERSLEALRAGRIYIVLVAIGEIALFSAMGMATSAAGTHEFAAIRQALVLAESRDLIILLALIGFGIKAGVPGLHIWLPLAHPVAPTPASAVLSGAMIKAGLLGWLRLLPLGEVTLPSWGAVFMVLGLLAAFYGVAIGLTQRDPKTLLAYSSISQMGLLTLAVGLGLTGPGADPALLSVISLYALHHALNKGALFLGVGLIRACSGAQLRKVWLCLWLPALALAGAPLTSGMLAKLLLKAQAINAPEPWPLLLQTLLPLSSVATALLVGRFLYLLFPPQQQPAHSLPAGLIGPWALLILGAIGLPWWLVPEASTFWSAKAFFGSFWPLLPGLLLTLAAIQRRARLLRRPEPVPAEAGEPFMGSRIPSIPAGDLLIPLSRCIAPILTGCRELSAEKLPRWRDAWLAWLAKFTARSHWGRILGDVEAGLNRWPAALVILMLLGLISASLAAGG